MSKLVYIATPYKNVGREKAIFFARVACYEVEIAGFTPVSPVLAFDGVFDESTQRQRALQAGIELLRLCNYIYAPFGSYMSEGVKKELEYARKKSILQIEPEIKFKKTEI